MRAGVGALHGDVGGVCLKEQYWFPLSWIEPPVSVASIELDGASCLCCQLEHDHRAAHEL